MDYKNIIESKYNRQSWQELLHDIFKSGAKFLENPLAIKSNSNLTETSLQLGNITLNDSNKIAVYEIKLAPNVDIVANRVGIRNLMLHHWKSLGCVGAFIFCYRDNESVLRFSYVSSLYKFNNEGDIERDETDTKRFTYLLGEGHRSRTAIAQFEQLKDSNLTLEDITKAFSVEALSNRFFKGYKEIYEDIVEYATGKRMIKQANKWNEIEIHSPNKTIMSEFSKFDDPNKSVRDYVKKLLGRIVFLQFLQKKGWLGVPIGEEWGAGDKEFLKNLLEQSNDKENFIDGTLEPLFNDINTKRDGDVANPILGTNIKIPYLNGGLFDIDGEDRCKFRLPVELLTKISLFFNSYNFTIDENDPDDAEVGVDPEMLGHIFENLLEDNKDKGAFYTPKSVVQYMCSESLIAYLQNDQDKEDFNSIREFVKTHKISVIKEDLKNVIDEKLKTVKICDPAIGSGAFPMGLLKELFECRVALEGYDRIDAGEIKKHIIQNNIYGVDIEKGAVDIARLRFWLSIVVDEKTPHALPNMDFKIVQGNSLIPTFRNKYINLDDKGRHLNSDKIRDAKKRLNHLQSLFFDSEGELKNELMVEIKYQILEIVKLQMNYEYTLDIDNNLSSGDLFNPEENKKVNIVDEEKNEIAGICRRLQIMLRSRSISLLEKANLTLPFFDWKIMFPEIFNEDISGFDIVIGNPPYVNAIDLKKNLGESEYKLLKSLYETSKGAVDFYVYFFEKGIKLLTENGILTFITPNKYLCANYAKELRNYFLENTQFIQLLDVSREKIFEASTYPIVTLVKKQSEQDEYLFKSIDKQKHIHSFSSRQLTEFPDNIWGFLLSSKYELTRKILHKSDNICEYCSINATSTAGEADRFHDYIIESSDSNLKLINTGTIDPFTNLWGKEYLKDKKIQYLHPTLPNDKSKLGANRLQMYNSPKIIIAKMSLHLEGFLDTDGSYASINTNCLHSFKIDPKFLLGWIHSKVFDYVYECFFEGLKMAGGYLPYSAPYLSTMCIPKGIDSHDEIKSIVNNILEFGTNEENIKVLNNIFYKIYELNREEIDEIENY